MIKLRQEAMMKKRGAGVGTFNQRKAAPLAQAALSGNGREH